MPGTDSTLLSAWIEEGDAEAFAELVARYSGLVYATCRRVLRDAAEAEDVAQECFFKLSRLKRARATGLGGLLHTMATRESLNRIKAHSRRRDREGRFVADRAPEVESQWDDIEGLIDEAIARLPEEIRYSIVAHFLEGRTQVAVAQDLEVDESTVRYRIRKGVDRVRASLEERGVVVGAGALTSLLSALAAQAAPVSLVATLGKVALVGGHASSAGGVGATAAVGGGLIMAKKVALLAAGVVAVIALGYGGVALQSRPVDPELAEEAAVEVQPPALNDLGIAAVGDVAEESVEVVPTNLIAEDSPLGEVLLALIETLGGFEVGQDPVLDVVASSDVPADNGMHFFLLASEMFDAADLDLIGEKWRELGAEAWQDPAIVALIEKYQDAFDAIREGLEVGDAMLPLFEGYFEEPMPYLADWRALARLMTIEADMLAEGGDYASAFAQYLLLIEFGNESATGGSAINGLVGYVIRNSSVDALREAVMAETLSAADYEGLIEELLALDGETFEVAIGEIDNLDLWLASSEDPMQELIDMAAELGTPIATSMFSDDELGVLWEAFLGHLETTVAYSELPFHEISSVDFEAIYDGNPFSLLMLQSYEKFAAAEANTSAEILGTTIVVAAEWYYSEEGVYPVSLSQLSPTYLSAVPLDPYTGEDFIYRIEGSRYWLYSPGRDLTDDGGDAWEPPTWVDGKDVVIAGD